MKKQGFVPGVFLIVFVLIAGCAEQVSKRLYTNTVYGFSLNPPAGWHSVENESLDVVVRFIPFNYSSVSLRIAPPFSLSEGRALSTFADEVEENLSESGMKYTIVTGSGEQLRGHRRMKLCIRMNRMVRLSGLNRWRF